MMKRIVLALLLCTHSVLAIPVKITGKVAKPLRDFVVFESRDILSGLLKRDTVKLAGEQFNYTLELKVREFTRLYLETDTAHRVILCVYPGQALKINFLPYPAQPQIEGEMARIQQFEANDKAYWTKIYSDYESRNPGFDKKEFLRTDAYFIIQDSITRDRIRNLTDFFGGKETPIEKAFIAYSKMKFIYRDLYYKQSYPDAPYIKFRFYQQHFNLHSGYTYTFSDLVNFDTPDLVYNPDYNNFVVSFLLSELHRRRNLNNIPFSYSTIISEACTVIDEFSKDPVAREQLKLVFLVYVVDDLARTKQAEDIEKLYNSIQQPLFKPGSAFSAVNTRLLQLIRYNKFKKGNIAPPFTFTDTLGKEIKLDDLKGKRVVIDVAASWCGPCIAGIPAWNKMVEENNDSQTVLIFLSLDNTKEESLELFNKHQPKGMLLFAGPGGFKSEFARTYEISILPNKIIIDKEGKIESYFD